MPYPPKHSPEGPEDYLKTVLRDPSLAARQAAADRLLIAAFHDRKLDINKLKAALDAGANPSRVVWKGYPALHLAVMRRATGAVELLLAHGAQVNDVDSRGRTALHEAVSIDCAPAVRLLKDYGGEYDTPVFESNYQTLVDEEMLSAIKRGDHAMIAAALSLGADANPPPDRPSPLLAAMYAADAVTADMLLAAGADPAMDHPREGTPLDALWIARNNKLLTPEWTALFAKMAALTPHHARTPDPRTLTVAQLLQPMPQKSYRGQTLMHFLICEGKEDVVLDVIRRDPSRRLTAADFLHKSKIFFNEQSLLSAIGDRRCLAKFMTPDVWQGRVDDMLALRPHIESHPLWKQQVDIDKAAAAVRAVLFRERRDRAQRAGFNNKPKFPGK